MKIILPAASAAGNRSIITAAVCCDARVLVLFVALVISACMGNGQSAVRRNASGQEAQVTAAQTGRTVQVCSLCHGFGGRSISPTFPRLAGQRAEYTGAQLKAFRDHERADPDAIAYMWGMAESLDDTMIERLASYYAAQAPAAGTPISSITFVPVGRITRRRIPHPRWWQACAARWRPARNNRARECNRTTVASTIVLEIRRFHWG